MSLFRPSARVTGPDGRDWEVYAYRFKLPERPRKELGFDPDLPEPRASVAAGALDGVLWLFGGTLRLAGLVLWHAPRAALRARGSDEWTIEAITWQPHRRSYTWKTTTEFRGHVLAQVEAGLARGEVPKPRHASYLGASG